MEFNNEALVDFYRMQFSGRVRPNGSRKAILVTLTDAKSIAKYSFHCHKSVTYLDLNLQEYSTYNKRFPTERKFYHKYVCTNQGLQKYLRPLEECEKTTLIQNFHLEIIKERETYRMYIERSTVNRNRVYDCETVYDVAAERYIHEFYLTNYIRIALEKNTEKLPIIKLCVKLMKISYFYNYFSKIRCKREFIPLIIKYCSDLELMIQVYKIFRFEGWITHECKPDELDFFLYHLHALKEGWKLLEKDMISLCLAESKYKKVEILLKYQNFIKPSYRSYERALGNLISERGLQHAEMKNFEEPTENNFQAIIIFLAFLSNSESAFQGLQLLWRSLPNCFITLDEFELKFSPILLPREIKESYNFYTDVIEQHAPSYQPRMLKHYCRIKIRNVLCEQQRLHDGIEELGLPPDLQLYLKLKN